MKTVFEPSWHNSTCPHDCPSACSLQVEKIAPDRIGRVRGSPHNSYTDGVICAKVSKYAERAHHPDRITHPMVRTSAKDAEPSFAPISWSDAFEMMTRKFQEAEREHGAESIWPYYYGGTMGLVQQGGSVRLANEFGFSGMKRTFCVKIAYDGWTAGAGTRLGSDPRELAQSDLIILWGCNAAATQINVMHHVSKARKRGAKLIVVDPYETPTAKIADLHIAPRPGTDGAVACAVMHQLFQKGLIDRDYLDKYAENTDDLEQHLSSRDPKWAETISGVPAERIETLAHWYGNTKKSYIRLGIGFSRSRNGAVNVHAVSCLPVLTGAWQYPGGGALLSTGNSFTLTTDLFHGVDPNEPTSKDGAGRVLDMSEIGKILCGDVDALQSGPPIKAMLIQNTNPMLVAPDLGRVKKGLSRNDLFVCVHEQFMTETAMMADLVLPATNFVEHGDIYTSYGHTFLQVTEKIIDTSDQCRSNHELINELAHRLGTKNRCFYMTEQEMISESLERSGYPQASEFTEQHFLDCAPSFEEAHFLNGFHWPNKRFRFSPDWPALGSGGHDMPTMPDHWNVIDQRDSTHPFKLVAAPSRGYLNSSFTQSPSSIKREKKPWIKMHPQAAKRCGLKNDDQATIGNKRGSVTATIRIMENIQVDTVVVEGIWPAKAFPEGIGINVLISSEPAKPSGGAVFHDTAVWVRPAMETPIAQEPNSG
ncbi:MAG: molybdopterin-dependent oxidoreductase [Gammaproteobacteria bacterium]|nr:molybdopterin-dependent oxidoreductase [Gammaproteobacteria bacterium]